MNLYVYMICIKRVMQAVRTISNIKITITHNKHTSIRSHNTLFVIFCSSIKTTSKLATQYNRNALHSLHNRCFLGYPHSGITRAQGLQQTSPGLPSQHISYLDNLHHNSLLRNQRSAL